MIFIALLLLPIFFKDRIKAMIIQEFEAATEATIYFDLEKFDLSLIKNFPNATVSLGDFGVVGKGIFARDTLAHVGELQATANLKKLLFDQEMGVKDVYLNEARIIILVLDGEIANYDIAKTVENNTDESLEEGGIDFGIESFSLVNSEFAYVDQTANIILQMVGIDVKGTGDLSADIFDLDASGEIEDVNVIYDQVEYVSQKSLSLDMILAMDMENSIYSFKENQFKINDFPLELDGEFGIGDDGFDMDIEFSTPSSDFKKLYSLIPGAYTESFSEIETKGNVGFNGKVFGTYNDLQMPGFEFNLNVDQAQVQYPGLPESINNINFDLAIENASGIVEETFINLQTMHVEFGTNPFDASLKILNLKDYSIESELKGAINLADLNKMIPVEGVLLEGQFNLGAKVKGKYDSINEVIPELDIILELTNGLIQSSEIPSPIEEINLYTTITNTTGKLSDTKVDVRDFKLSIDEQPFSAKAKFENPDNISWEAVVKGDLDFDKILALFPMEGMSLKGKLSADLASSGTMEAIENEQYDRLSTSGKIDLKDFIYYDSELDKTFEIKSAKTSFSTKAIVIESLEGKAGKTNYSVDGKLSNYLGFALKEELLAGNLNMQADLIDVNEWMVEEDTTNVSPDDSDEPMEVVRLPENIDFVFDANVDKVVYNKLAMNNMQSNLSVKNGAMELKGSKFEFLNGTVGLKGKYDSKPVKPSFDFGFNVNQLSIPASFDGVSIIQKMAPIAQNMVGNFNTDFAISGLLNSDMTPDFNAISGKGIVEVLEATMGQTPITAALSSVSSLTDVVSATMQKIKMQTEIKNGRFYVKPFKVDLGSYQTEVSGSTGIDGSLEYILALDVPATKAGNQLSGMLSSLSKNTINIGSDLILDLGLGGTYLKPKVTLSGVRSKSGESIDDAVTASIKAKIEEEKEELKETVVAEITEVKDSVTQVADVQVAVIKDTVNTIVENQLDSTATKLSKNLGLPVDSLSKEEKLVKDKAEGIIKGLFKKKKKKKKGTGG